MISFDSLLVNGARLGLIDSDLLGVAWGVDDNSWSCLLGVRRSSSR